VGFIKKNRYQKLQHLCLFFRCCSFGVAGTRWAAGGGVGRSSRSSSSACVGTFVPLCHAARPAPPAVGFIKLCGHGCRLVAAIWAVCAVDAHRERILLLPNRFLGGIHTTSVMASCGVYIYIYTQSHPPIRTPRHATLLAMSVSKSKPTHPTPRLLDRDRGPRRGCEAPDALAHTAPYSYSGLFSGYINTGVCGQ